MTSLFKIDSIMAISDKVSMALSEWAFKVASSFLPHYRIPAGSTIGNMMQGFFGIDPAGYNVWNELGFLAEPLIQTMVTPAVNRMLGGMTDEQAHEVVMKMVDSFIDQARAKGEINLFGIHMKEDAFQGLKELLTARMEE